MKLPHPPNTTLEDMNSTQTTSLGSTRQDFHTSSSRMTYWRSSQNPSNHLSTIVFATGHNALELITMPYQNGVLHLHYWVDHTHLLDYYLSCLDMLFVGIHCRTFKQYPTSHGLPFPHAHTIFYWTQDLKMPINQALQQSCAGVPDYKHLRGNILALKHRQSAPDKFEDMMSEDMGLMTSLISWCAQYYQFFFLLLTSMYLKHSRSRFAWMCGWIWSGNERDWRVTIRNTSRHVCKASLPQWVWKPQKITSRSHSILRYFSTHFHRKWGKKKGTCFCP